MWRLAQRLPTPRQKPDPRRLALPARAEGFDRLYFVRAQPDEQFEILNWEEGGSGDEGG